MALNWKLQLAFILSLNKLYKGKIHLLFLFNLSVYSCLKTCLNPLFAKLIHCMSFAEGFLKLPFVIPSVWQESRSWMEDRLRQKQGKRWWADWEGSLASLLCWEKELVSTGNKFNYISFHFLRDEIGLIPCPEARYNRSPIVLVENKLGVESWCIKFLLPYVHNKLLLYRQRKQWLNKDGKLPSWRILSYVILNVHLFIYHKII